MNVLRLFRRRVTTPDLPQSSAAPSGSAPARPPRTRAHSDTVRRYREEYERVRVAELAKLREREEADSFEFDSGDVPSLRTGSFMIRTDTAVQQSQKQRQNSQLPVQKYLEQPAELSDLLSNAFLRHLFRNFLKSKFAGESLMLFETIELFNSMTRDEWRVPLAEGIMDQFVLDTAELGVNISARDRSELIARYKTQFWPEHSFDAVMREMYDLMRANYFPAFCLAFGPWPLDVDSVAARLETQRRRTTLSPQTLPQSPEFIHLLSESSSSIAAAVAVGH